MLHTHMPYATALSCLRDFEFLMLDQNACRFYDRIAYDRHYSGMALDDAEGERVAGLLGDEKSVLFLGNHGVMTAAPTVAQAWDDLYFLERAAKTQIIAMSTGRRLALLSPEMTEQVRRQTEHERIELGYIERHFAAQLRLLDAKDPSYRA